MTTSRTRSLSLYLLVPLFLLAVASAQDGKPAAEPLRVVATLPDLGSLATAIGGEFVHVDVLVRGGEDPHFTAPRPSLVRVLARAEMLVVAGLDLEYAWLQPLCDNARNPAILRTAVGNLGNSNTGTGYAAEGYVDVSLGISLRGLLTDRLDRSLGDVHRGGNPHYLTDPLCGLQAAGILRDRFTAVRPEGKETFAKNFAALRERVAKAMVGDELAKLYDYDAETLGQLFELDRLDALLAKNGDEKKLGGWFGAMRSHRGTKVVADHDLWPYFAARFGLVVRAFLEPRAGIAPTPNHLEQIVGLMKQERIHVVLAAPYFSPQHAEFVARETGARIAQVAHQCGSREGCDEYVAMVDYNVRTVVAAIEAKQ